MPAVDPMRWTAVQHGQQYKVHYQQHKSSGYNRDHSSRQDTGRSPTAFIMHWIRTTATIISIRNLPRIQKLLRDNGVYFTEHRWPEDVYDISQQGFMLGIDPHFYTPAQAHERISSALTNAFKTATPAVRIPKFVVAFCTPQVTIGTSVVRTKAYAIETEKSKAVDMQRVLKEACKKTNEFIPFHLRSKHPEAFSRHIQQHSRILSQNHTIVLNYIGNQSILYLDSWIRAVPGVIDIVPSQSVETDGKFRVQVKKEDFHKVRSKLSKNLIKWYEDYVPQDAKKLTSKFPRPPEVAPLMSDGYSSGSDGYMTASINTAMSYASVVSNVSNLTGESHVEGHTQRREKSTMANNIHQGKQNNTPPPSTIQATPETDAGLISELQSSRSEVEALKQQLTTMETDKQAQIKQLEHNAQQQRLKAEQREKDYQSKMEAQAEAQRQEFRKQLEDQRLAFERQIRLRQQEMEDSIQRHVDQALQAHLPVSNASTPIQNTPVEVVRRIESQDAQIQKLTEMIQQLVTRTTPAASSRPARPSTGKRQASSHTGDLLMDNHDMEQASQKSQLTRIDPCGKKRDTKETPRQNLSGNICIQLERQGSPVPSDLSMSMMDPPPLSQTTEHLRWDGLHPPSEVYSPPARQRSYRLEGDLASPVSNLALHPNFRIPGDRFLSDDSAQVSDHYHDKSTTQSIDDSQQFSEAYLRDIHDQHIALQGFETRPGNADRSQGEEQVTAKGPSEDDNGSHQATPADGSNRSYNHE